MCVNFYFKNVSVFGETLIPKRWVKEFEKSGSNEEPLLTPKASVTVSKCKKNQPKSVFEKFNKASEICRDIANLLPTCGEAEFEEKNESP